MKDNRNRIMWTYSAVAGPKRKMDDSYAYLFINEVRISYKSEKWVNNKELYNAFSKLGPNDACIAITSSSK